MRLLIVHCSAGAGHRAAAIALAAQAAERGHVVEILNALEYTPAWFGRGYEAMHLKTTAHTPWLYGLGYASMNDRNRLRDGVRRTVDRRLASELRRVVLAFGADCVVATHFFPLSVLGKERARGRLRAPLYGVVTDYTAHAMWAEPNVDGFFCAPGRARRDLLRAGVASHRIHATGIPIRGDFRPAPLPMGKKRELLLTSGGAGVGQVETTLASLRTLPNTHITAVCGRNEELKARLERLVRRFAIDCSVVGFERDMARRLREAHLLIGKAGGLTISETLAVGRGMLLAGTCPGQELANERWLTGAGAAIAIDPCEAADVVTELFAHGRQVGMAKRARGLARPNASHDLLDCLENTGTTMVA